MFKIRLGGSNDFVSKIDPNDRTCSPPGSIETVAGWDNKGALVYATKEAADKAAEQVWELEGFHTCVEDMKDGG